MHLDFVPSHSGLQMLASSEAREASGLCLSYDLTLKSDSPTVSFKDGSELRDCVCHLLLRPQAESRFFSCPHVGEMSPTIVSLTGGRPAVVQIEAGIPDSQFNVLLSEASKGRPPYCITIHIKDDGIESFQDGIWDVKLPINELIALEILFTLSFAK